MFDAICYWTAPLMRRTVQSKELTTNDLHAYVGLEIAALLVRDGSLKDI